MPHPGLINDARAVLAAVAVENQQNRNRSSWMSVSDTKTARQQLVAVLQDGISSSDELAEKAKKLLSLYPTLRVYNGLKISLTNGVQLPFLYNGYTPMHWAVIDHNQNEFRMDINEYNMNLFAQDNLGRTALHVAALQGELQEFLPYIPESKQDELLAIRDYAGKTVLHLIAEQRQFAQIRRVPKLLQNRLSFIKDLTGKTALHLAAERGQFQEFLQHVPENEKNELMAITDTAGRTAASYAAQWDSDHPEEENRMEHGF